MTPEGIKEVREAWQPFYEEELTDDDAVEIINNLSGFFQILAEEKERQDKLKENKAC